METSAHEDMHGGEGETSILLRRIPDVVRSGFEDADHVANDRRHLLSAGMRPVHHQRHHRPTPTRHHGRG